MSVVNIETGEIVEFDKPAAERRAERITLRLDAIADNYAAVMPMIRESIEQRDDLALGYRSPGDYVADRFGGSLQRLGIGVRRAVVGELTAAGLSTRAIAPVVGVSHMTVQNDVVSGVKTFTPAPQTPEPAADAVGATAAAPVHDLGGLQTSSLPREEPAEPAPVVGIDGKMYRRTDRAELLAEAVAEFPDLAFYAETDPNSALRMAGDLRRYRERGELDERLENLRRSTALDRSKRDGTYVPVALPTLSHCRTCTCNGSES